MGRPRRNSQACTVAQPTTTPNLNAVCPRKALNLPLSVPVGRVDTIPCLFGVVGLDWGWLLRLGPRS